MNILLNKKEEENDMKEKKKSTDQKAKEAIINLYHGLGKEAWFVAKVATPSILYGAFNSEGVNIYKYDKIQPIFIQTHEWKNFNKASVDSFIIKTIITLNGESHSTTITMMEKGKELVKLLRSNTSITVQNLDRPLWRKVLGFRSKTKWKMIVAVIAYLAIFGGIINANSSQPVTVPQTAPVISPSVPVPVVKTPEELKAEKDKADADKIVADAKAIEDKKIADAKAVKDAYTTWVTGQFSVWNGSNTYLVDLIKENLNDAKSFEHVKTTYVDKGDRLIVKMTYRAKNAFGGVILQNVTATSDYKTGIIKVTSQND